MIFPSVCSFLIQVYCLSFQVITKGENIGNYGYIGTSILWIYRKYNDKYFEMGTILTIFFLPMDYFGLKTPST